jgi:hypothetical protein
MDRRRRSRIALRSGHALQVTIAPPNRRARVVDILNIGSRGMLFEYPCLAPLLGIGTRVCAQLRLGKLVATLPAITRHQNGGRYGLRFESENQSLHRILAVLERQCLPARKAV